MEMENVKEMEFNTEVPATEGQADKEERKFFDNEGNEISCSAFCRLKFLEDNMSKRQIADEFGINYRTVYGACQNLVNTAVTERKGRAASEAMINLNENGEVVVFTKDGKTLVNGVETDIELSAGACNQVNRKEWVLAKLAEGMDKTEIATILNVSHGVIYNITKDTEVAGSRTRVKITLEDGTEVERSAYIKQLFAEGHNRSEIASLLNVPYNVVYAATKETKSDYDRYTTAIDAVAKFAKHISNEDKEAFEYTIQTLKEFAFVAEAEPVDEEVIAEAEETDVE